MRLDLSTRWPTRKEIPFFLFIQKSRVNESRAAARAFSLRKTTKRPLKSRLVGGNANESTSRASRPLAPQPLRRSRMRNVRGRAIRFKHRARSGDLSLGITFSLQSRNAANSKSVKVTSRGCDTFPLPPAWHESEGEEPQRSPPRSIDSRESQRNVYKNMVPSGLNNFHAYINSRSLLQSW